MEGGWWWVVGVGSEWVVIDCGRVWWGVVGRGRGGVAEAPRTARRACIAHTQHGMARSEPTAGT